MAKRILLYSIIALFPFIATAKERSSSEIHSIAASKIQTLGKGNIAKAKGTSGSNTTILLALDMPQLCVFNGDNGGFVIVSKDDCVAPVIAYSTETFNANDIPCGLKWWMESTSKAINSLSRTSDIVYKDAPFEYNAVEPLITTRWGQNKPFNELTPTIQNAHTPTGCVATAMAQILKYNQYPSSAEFMGSYSVGEGGATRKEFVSSVYNYDMPDGFGIHYVNGQMINNRTATDEQKAMVARLMYDCGLASNMNYDAGGSGATASNYAKAFAEYFSYPHNSVKLIDKSIYTDSEWKEMIYKELMRGYPILYSGATTERAGHAFVAHGIDEKGLIAINWGWNGKGDGFFNMDILNSDEGSYSEFQDAIIGIRKTALPDDVETSCFANDALFNGSFSKFLKSVTISGRAFNYGAYAFNGKLKYRVVDEADGSIQEDLIQDCSESSINPLYGRSIDININTTGTGTISVEPGHSYIVFGYSQLPEEAADGRISLFRESNGKHGDKVWFRITINSDNTATVEHNNGKLPDIATGIKGVKTNHSSNKVYDILGRPATQSTRGLVIKNGKTLIQK